MLSGAAMCILPFWAGALDLRAFQPFYDGASSRGRTDDLRFTKPLHTLEIQGMNETVMVL